MISFDHASAGMEIMTIQNNQNVNTQLGSQFYNETTSALVADSINAGNSDSTSQTSLTNAGLIV